MTKDNILFAVIGVLLGIIAGYVFATTVNQRGYATQTAQPTQTAEDAAGGSAGPVSPDAELPPNHPALPPDGAAEDSSAEQALIERAQAAPDDYDAQMQAAALHYQNRRFNEAIELLTRANRLKPKEYQPLVALGNANFDAGRYEAAERWYTAALVKNPGDVNVRTDLGLTFLFREPQDVERAIKEFRRSLELDPRHELTLQNMTVALTRRGNLAAAQAMLDKLAEVNPRNENLAELRSKIEQARTMQPGQPAGRKN